jgi:uncharacterized protein
MIFCFLFDTIISNFKGSNVKHFHIIPKNVTVPDTYSKKNSKAGSTVMITGGNGLVGKYLTSNLLSAGYHVLVLSRNTDPSDKVKAFSWNPEKKIIDPAIFEGVDYLIHLAGTNIGEKRWTKKRKEEIITSRTGSAMFLHKIISENKINLKAFISASAIGYYGSVTSEKIFREEDPPSEDFLGKTCRLWEEGADLFTNIGIRTVKIRTAVVLEKNDSPLSKLMKPARFGVVVRLGNGRQYFPWIHIKDLCGIYMKAIEDKNMHGAYNAVAPEHVNHNDFVRTMARIMNLPVFIPPVPAWILRKVIGEMSDIVLKGSRISGDKIINAGFNFRFKKLDDALRNVIQD